MLGGVKKLGGAAVVAAILILAGCSASAAPTPPPTVAESQTPVADPGGTTLLELQADYVAAGGQCDQIAERASIAVAEEAGDCDGGALLTTYRSETQRDSAISVLDGAQATNPSPYEIAVGPDWIVNGADAGSFAAAMGGVARQIGVAAPPAAAQQDLTTDEGLCAADAEMTNLELNDALAPVLGFPADRDARTSAQDDEIREYKNAAFARACPARVG